MLCKECPLNKRPYMFTLKGDGTIWHNRYPLLTEEELKKEIEFREEIGEYFTYKEISFKEYNKIINS